MTIMKIILLSFGLGMGGTALMTLFLYVLDYAMGEKRLKVVKVLGTMLTGKTTAVKGLSDSPWAILIGLAGHYGVGIVFAAIFILLEAHGVCSFTYLHGLLYGGMAGLTGIIVWRIYLYLHPYPPILNIPLYLSGIFIGHLIFGIGMILTYQILLLLNISTGI